MKVILLERIRNLGQFGDVVQVKPGYARNYLIPKGKATDATPLNLAVFETKRETLEAQAQAQWTAAQSKAEKLQGLMVTIVARASEEGKLYGSVGANDISQAIMEQANISIDKKDIHLANGPIRFVGETQVMVQLHNEIAQSICVVVTTG